MIRDSRQRLYRGKILLTIIALLLFSYIPQVLSQEPKMGGTLKLIPHADLKVLDPIWTTAYITRNHGYMIYDTLFALDENLKVQPQQDGVRKKQLVEEIQKLAYEEVPYVAVGQSVYLIAYHDYVRGLPKFTAPVFWNVWLDKK